MAKSTNHLLNRVSTFLSRSQLRYFVLVPSYALGLTLCLGLSWLLRFDFHLPKGVTPSIWLSIGWVVPGKLLLLLLFRQFSGMLTFFAVRDLIRLFGAMASSSIVLFLVWALVETTDYYMPSRGVILVDFVLSFLGLAGLRLFFRLAREHFSYRSEAKSGAKESLVAIMGAGHFGANLAKDLFTRRGLGLRPVVFFDDSEDKWKTRVHDVPVIGKPEMLLDEDLDVDLDELIIALPGGSSKRIRDVVRIAQEAGLKCQTIPSFEELATGRVKVSQLRHVQIQDLLGRDPVELEHDSIRRLIQGRTIMVTGAGGSIGSELCRQIAGFNPKRVLLVEQCEVQLFKIEQELISLGYGSSLAPLIADILDRERMHVIFQRFQPDGVFHAAAHKHVPMMEHQPSEAFKNNSMGTAIVSELAEESGVDFFLMVSTDKAINPTSVMGATKRLGEVFIQSLNATQPEGTKFLAVRFGNVLGSSGSVVPIFEKQIEAGGPVKVTHPDVTRYFMTIPEAVGLVLQSAVHAEGGEIFVLDMGEPVKIVDLARQLIELHGQEPDVDIEVQFTGLRPGEKLFEEISHEGENLVATGHPKIMRFVCEPQQMETVKRFYQDINRKMYVMEPDQFKQRLRESIPEYTPYYS